ncbi:MAG: T9SS type A sorting domain-containing protein [Bacteroidales bacterium]|nr:T9SS type A sorting domain-containing protein [Bacteroidales bacterium]
MIDNLAGADIDLLQTPSYTFTARNDDYASRFKLVFNVQQGGEVADEDFAFISNGELIVNGTGTLQVIDALGRELVCKKLSPLTSHLSLLTFKPGVYVLRLVNGEKLKTQKIVIR